MSSRASKILYTGTRLAARHPLPSSLPRRQLTTAAAATPPARPAAQSPSPTQPAGTISPAAARPKTQAEQDAQLVARMKEAMGGGGEAGVEYEDGAAAEMKRGVRANMFRYI